MDTVESNKNEKVLDRASFHEFRSAFKRPGVIIALVVLHVYITANYLIHARFVQSVIESWENFDGVRCGTGMLMSWTNVLITCFPALIPLGVGFVSYYGFAPSLLRNSDQGMMTVRQFFQRSMPWQAVSGIWVSWLIIVNVILSQVLLGEELSPGAMGESFVVFVGALFVLLASWAGVAPLAVIWRLMPGTPAARVASWVLFLGCLVFIPFVVHRLYYLRPIRDFIFEQHDKWFLVLFAAPEVYLVIYLGILIVLFPCWWRWLRNHPESMQECLSPSRGKPLA